MQIKKIVAGGLAAVMAGATLAGGALSAPVSVLPDALGSDGQLDAFVVVGEDAASKDVAGAIDLAANLASLNYVEVGTSSGGTIVTTGGKTEDLDVGTSLNATAAFTGTVDDSDLSGLADAELTVSIGGTSETYDYHEEIRLGDGSLGTISVETGLSADSPDEEFEDNVFLQVLPGAVEYRLVFDENLKVGTMIANATSDDPVVLDFMGRELQITSADADSITVDVGERFFLQAGESATTTDGTVVTLLKATSTNKAQITVNGETDILNEDAVRSIGGTEVKVTDVADDDGIEFDSAVVIVGTDSTFGEATDTFDSGEEYVIPCGTAWMTDGCDNDDPDWIWNLAGLDTATPTLGVKFNERIDSADDNPPIVGGDNNVFDLPGGFAWIQLGDTTSDTYQKYEITDRTKDTLREDEVSLTGGARVAEFSGAGSDDSFTLSVEGVTKDTDNIYFSTANNNRLELFWEDPDNGNKIKRFMNITSNGTTSNVFQIDFEGTSVPVDVQVAEVSGVIQFNVSITGDVGSNVLAYVQEDAAGSGQITYVGHSDSDTTTANDLMYGTRDISGWEESTLTPDGLRIVDPDQNSPSDKYVFEVPTEFGSNDFQVFVTVGSSGTTTSVTGGDGAIRTQVPVTSSIARLDTEITASEKASRNLVLVGGPAVNRLTADAMGLPYPSYGAASGIPENAGLISIVDDHFATGKIAVIAAGWTADDTRLVTSVLQNAATALAGESAESVVVSGSSVATASIVPHESTTEEAMEETA